MAIEQVSSGSKHNILALLFRDEGSDSGAGTEFSTAFALSLNQSDTAEANVLPAEKMQWSELQALMANIDATDTALAESAGVDAALTGTDDARSVLLSGSIATDLLTADPESEVDVESDDLLEVAAIPVLSVTLDQRTDLLPAAPVGRSVSVVDLSAAGETGADSATAAPFSRGIQHLIDLVREVGQLRSMPADMVTAANSSDGSGKLLPPDGKALPSLLTPAVSGNHALPQSSIPLPDLASIQTQPLESLAGFDLPDSLTGIGLLAETPGEGTNPGWNSPAAATIISARDSRSAPATVGGPGDAVTLYSEFSAGTEEWLQELGTRIEWLQDAKLQSAGLQLHPADLGTLDIQIVADENGNSSISFVTQTTSARELIESTLPRLRELLAQQGLQLDQSSVSQHSAEGQKRPQGPSGQTTDARSGEISNSEELRSVQARANRALHEGSIDHYV